MATIEELERQNAEIAQGEAEVIEELVADIRKAAVALPEGSELARILAGAAQFAEAYGYHAGITASHLLNRLSQAERDSRWKEAD